MTNLEKPRMNSSLVESRHEPSLRDIVKAFVDRGLENHEHLTRQEAVALTLASANGVDKFDLLHSFGIIRRCATCALIYANHKDSSKPAPGTVFGVDTDDC